jgi:hypothetical protein
MWGRRGPAALARLCLPWLKRAHSQTQSPLSLAQQTDRAAAGSGPHSSFQKGGTYKSSSSSSCLLLGNELSHHLPFNPAQSSSLCQTHTNTWTIIVPANKTSSWPKVENKKIKIKKEIISNLFLLAH